MNYPVRLERKLGSEILATIADIQITPKDNLKRFLVLKKRLEKQVRRYTELTGSDFLMKDKISEYGYIVD